MIILDDVRVVSNGCLYSRKLNWFEQRQLLRQIERVLVNYNVIAFSKVVKEPQR